ncbi:BET1-like protein isoform X2 [Ornithorhynchus anatinus]|uniref:BET1-like protein isoform X2 n=1 Tax=Ornithorhynchus anatinus TaxID=9258 RepID=UPI0010A93F5D|nr:BET1-like protein isoform X2 [Ornithorhynchus anatinus]
MADWGRGGSSSAVDDLLDVENKRIADGLATKVTRLKSLALDIDKDAEDQNRYLDGMAVQSEGSGDDQKLEMTSTGRFPQKTSLDPPSHFSPLGIGSWRRAPPQQLG